MNREILNMENFRIVVDNFPAWSVHENKRHRLLNSNPIQMNLEIRRLREDERIPYDLLLLADETIEAIDRYILQSEIYILERDHKAAAVYVLHTLDADCVEIKNIAVDEKLQGQGIGRSLLEDATRRATIGGYKTIIIGTGDGSIRQLGLYQKEGFEIFDIRKGFFIDNYPAPIYENGIQLRDMIMLRKQLR